MVSIERNEVIIRTRTILEDHHLEQIVESGCQVYHPAQGRHEHQRLPRIIYNTLQKILQFRERAVEHIYRQLRNAEPPDEETARGIIDKLFFSDKRI